LTQALSSDKPLFHPATDLSSSNRSFIQQPTFHPATDLSSSNRPFIQQPTFLYNYPLLFVIPSEAEGSAVPRTFLGNVFRPEQALRTDLRFKSERPDTSRKKKSEIRPFQTRIKVTPECI
jgi:hypothetical protein